MAKSKDICLEMIQNKSKEELVLLLDGMLAIASLMQTLGIGAGVDLFSSVKWTLQVNALNPDKIAANKAAWKLLDDLEAEAKKENARLQAEKRRTSLSGDN